MSEQLDKYRAAFARMATERKTMEDELEKLKSAAQVMRGMLAEKDDQIIQMRIMLTQMQQAASDSDRPKPPMTDEQVANVKQAVKAKK